MLEESIKKIFELLSKKKIEITLLTFFKKVPVSCKAKILSVKETIVIFKLESCSLTGAFYECKHVYIKVEKAPKSIKCSVEEFDPVKQMFTLRNFRFEEIPQERRRFVRVKPKENISILIKSEKGEAKGFILDISIGGVGILFSDPPTAKEGNKIKLYFELEEKFFS